MEEFYKKMNWITASRFGVVGGIKSLCLRHRERDERRERDECRERDERLLCALIAVHCGLSQKKRIPSAVSPQADRLCFLPSERTSALLTQGTTVTGGQPISWNSARGVMSSLSVCGPSFSEFS